MLLDSLFKIIENLGTQPYPVLGAKFQKTDYAPISLNVQEERLKNYNVTHYDGLEQYVKDTLIINNAKVVYGGYGEHRIIYTSSEHFNNDAESRCIHLGIDLWAEAGTPVFAPLDGVVHSFKYNNQTLDYGATIITQHQIEGNVFYLLFGHLSLKSLENRYKNEPILRGSHFAWLGDRNENGGWVPHLHLQVITDLGDWEGDFPGVATRAESAKYLENCPSPEVFCGY